MARDETGDEAPSLSIVVPSFNSAEWLPSTISAIAAAVLEAELAVELIVVDDGSTDDTAHTVESLADSFPGAVELVRQENRGRFLARWEGLTRSRSRWVLLLDSRVLLAPTALKYVMAQLAADPTRKAWNSFAVIADDAPLVGRFWDVPTYVFWGSFLRSPRPFDLTRETFDSAPKGTTAFLASRDVLIDAFEFAWPEGDAKLVSDDTKVLRRIAERWTIRLDPGFAAIYRPRTTVRGFVRHTRDRGTLFVDSYAGTSLARSIILVLLVVVPPLVLAGLIMLALAGFVGAVLAAIALILAVVATPVIIAASRRCPARSIIAFVLYLPIFVVPFWLGLARGIVMHRRVFVHRRQASASEVERQHP